MIIRKNMTNLKKLLYYYLRTWDMVQWFCRKFLRCFGLFHCWVVMSMWTIISKWERSGQKSILISLIFVEFSLLRKSIFSLLLHSDLKLCRNPDFRRQIITLEQANIKEFKIFQADPRSSPKGKKIGVAL